MSNPEKVIENWKKKNNLRSILDLTCWRIDELPDIPDEVEYLDISNTTLLQITKLPKNLKWLRCRRLDYVKTLPHPLPENLRFIDCRSCLELEPFDVPKHIKIRSHFKETLEERYHENTPHEKILEERLEEIRNTPKKTLDLTWLDLTELPEIPEKVKRLYCGSNPITKIGKLPKGLKVLNCSDSFITKFENIPDSVREVICSKTYIESFDGLPDSVESITADYCEELKDINYFPSELKKFYSQRTSIRNIKYFPNKLKILELYDTDIENIPELPESLKVFDCLSHHRLKTITNIPKSLEILKLYIPLNITIPPLHNGLKILIIDSLEQLGKNIPPRFLNSQKMIYITSIKELGDNILPESIELLETREVILSIDKLKLRRVLLCFPNSIRFLF
jgi:hypothetical protein